MPELPEVETMVRDLRIRVVGERLTGGHFSWERTAAHPDSGTLLQGIAGRVIEGIDRRGKFALARLDDGSTLAFHRGMTGSVLVRAEGAPDDRFVRAWFQVENGSQLRFDDARKFGRIYLVGPDSNGYVAPWTRLGLEPLGEEMTPEAIGLKLRGRRVAIKAALLNQTLIAGLGNIYADEALFAAEIHPLRPAGSLDGRELERLAVGIQTVLQDAIGARGTTFSTYRDVEGNAGGHQFALKVFQRQPGPCPRCGGVILRTVVAARGTHFCKDCQV